MTAVDESRSCEEVFGPMHAASARFCLARAKYFGGRVSAASDNGPFRIECMGASFALADVDALRRFVWARRVSPKEQAEYAEHRRETARQAAVSRAFFEREASRQRAAPMPTPSAVPARNATTSDPVQAHQVALQAHNAAESARHQDTLARVRAHQAKREREAAARSGAR